MIFQMLQKCITTLSRILFSISLSLMADFGGLHYDTILGWLPNQVPTHAQNA